MDHRCHRLALQGQTFQGGPRKSGLLCHPLHYLSCGERAHASVPEAGNSRRWRAGWAADLQNNNVADVCLIVADLHPAGFPGGLLPYTRVLNGKESRGRESPTANMKRERERESDAAVLKEGVEMDRYGPTFQEIFKSVQRLFQFFIRCVFSLHSSLSWKTESESS